MLLCELFDNSGGSLMRDLRKTVLDFLTPKAAHKVDYVTVSSLLDYLKDQNSGVTMDRAMIMDLCDPNRLPMVKKIEGNLIYLTVPMADGEDRAVDADEAEADAEHVTGMASKHAKDALKKK